MQWGVEVMEELPIKPSVTQRSGSKDTIKEEKEKEGTPEESEGSLQEEIEAHLGRLPNLYLASIVTRCITAFPESSSLDAGPSDEADSFSWLVKVQQQHNPDRESQSFS